MEGGGEDGAHEHTSEGGDAVERQRRGTQRREHALEREELLAGVGGGSGRLDGLLLVWCGHTL